MLTGLGFAETTPGPLIQVVQYVGFLGAYRDPAPFSPLLAAALASVVVTWATYAPCFLWILGAPYIERLRDNRALAGALSSITAAVVGVILNLSIWFALHTLFARVEVRQFGLPAEPARPRHPEPARAFYCGGGRLLMWRRWGTLAVLGVSCAPGVLWYLASGG